jgi:hypothetical protein
MNLNELRKMHERLTSGNTGGGGDGNLDKYLKVNPGENHIRILPWKDDSRLFYSEASIHRYTDNEGKVKNYYCRKIENNPCPVCEFHFDLWKQHKALGLEPKVKSKFGDLATKIKGTPRYYMNVVDRAFLAANADKLPEAVRIFSTGQKVLKKIMDGVFNQDLVDETDPDNTTVLSLKKGNDFVLKLGKIGEFNNYDESSFRIKKNAAGKDKEIAVWMESLHDIHGLIKCGTAEEGKSIVDYLKTTIAMVPSGPTPYPQSDDLGEGEFQKELKV